MLQAGNHFCWAILGNFQPNGVGKFMLLQFPLQSARQILYLFVIYE